MAVSGQYDSERRSYMIVFASSKSKNYVDPAGYLHTTFSLSASGEYLGLTRPDGTVVHAYQSVLNEQTAEYGFPAQRDNISYGMLSNSEYYFSLPTPGQENRQSFLGFVDEPEFSHERGYYEDAFSLILSCGTSGATIRYTSNGTDPTLSMGLPILADCDIGSDDQGDCGSGRGIQGRYETAPSRPNLPDEVHQRDEGIACGMPVGQSNRSVL